ncbi:hypothetical protein [Sporomusa sp. KB1]|jgi:hypothetical protein|uniref:hypothetical protein n=1 Tax=Sporomusa sp. KB1 TaxID=943346 RepID=UPI0011A0A8BC|nr:hypothetical protein [Sporomusa sp. KB1]TWH48285.1 hypothetical protein Salpa_4431 [Sporomusa sp. KB1]
MEISTGALIKILKNAKDLKIFLQENESSITDPTLREYLEKLLSLKGLKRQDVIKSANLDSNYINQLFSGIKTKPGRNQTLSLAFGFGLNNEETARLLKFAEVGALYPKNKRDAIIIHSLETGKSITQANEILSSLDLGTLSDHRK